MLRRLYQNSFIIFFFVLIGFLLLTTALGAYPSLRKPLIMDEMEFPAVAIGIINTGKPIYYRSEIYPQNIGLWHPPFYILVYAVWHALLGTSVLVSRSFGLFTNIASLVMIGIFAFFRLQHTGHLVGNLRKNYFAIIIGLAMASTAPLFIQGSILPDIDTQVLPLLTCLFFLVVFTARSKGKQSRAYQGAFISLLALSFFAKLTTPILLIPAFIMYEIASILFTPNSESNPHSYAPEKSLLRTDIFFKHYRFINIITSSFYIILLSVLALIVMIVTWFAISIVWRVEFSLPFVYLLNSSNNPASRGSGIIEVIAAILESVPYHSRFLFQWFGYPSIIFIGIMIIREFIRPVDGFLTFPERIALYTYSIMLALMYIVLKPAPFDFPKYYPPLFIPLSLLGIEALTSICNRSSGKLIYTLICLQVTFYFLYFYIRFPLPSRDFIYQIYWVYPRLPVFTTWMLAPLVIAAITNAYLLSKKYDVIDGLLVAAIIVAIGWQLVIMQVQMVVPYSTTYLYGENSVAKVTLYLRSSLPENALIIAPKDVGAILQDRWPYIELGTDPNKYFSNPQVTHLIMRTNDYYGNTIRANAEISAAIDKDFVLENTIENFVVLRHKFRRH